MRLLVELEQIHEWCIVIKGGGTKVFQHVIGHWHTMLHSHGVRPGWSMLHNGWDMRTKVGVVWPSICYNLQIQV